LYVEHTASSLRFRWVKATTSAELIELAQRIAQRVGRHLERQGLLQRDAQTSYLPVSSSTRSRKKLRQEPRRSPFGRLLPKNISS
jgi:hypothetical protein